MILAVFRDCHHWLTTPIVVDGLVTDQLRGELGVPSLPSDAKQAGHLGVPARHACLSGDND